MPIHEEGKPGSIYPRRDSLIQVQEEGIAQLPINTPNELISLLKRHENTVIFVVSQDSLKVGTNGNS
jgi:hypothetical protein